MSQITDFSHSTMRIDARRLRDLPAEALEMLRVYPVRSWVEEDTLCYKVASYRVEEIERACRPAIRTNT